MIKYTTKPVVLDAIQFKDNWVDIARWLDQINDGKYVVPLGEYPKVCSVTRLQVRVLTPHGRKTARCGDYIVRIEGFYDVYSPDMFEMLFAPIRTSTVL